MQKLLALLLLITAIPCLAQEKPRVNDKDKPYLTVITHADWEKRPEEKRLIENLKSEPTLSVALLCHCNHYTSASAIYKERWVGIFPESSLPVVIFQRPDGGSWYKASQGNIPTTSRGILQDLTYYTMLAPDSQQPVAVEPVQEDDTEDRPGWRPFKDRRDQDNDDSYEMFGGKTPLRDSLAGGATIFIGGVAIAAFLAIACVAIIAASVINKIFK